MRMGISKTIRAAAFLFIIHHSSLITSAQDWTLSTADFRTESVKLRAIDGQGVHVVSAEREKPSVVPLEAFVQIDRSLPAGGRPAKFSLNLRSGDRVGGEPVKVEGDRLTWRNPAVGELVVPLSQVASLARAGRTPDTAASAEDVVLLSNGDSVRGIVTAMSSEDVHVKATGGGDEPLAVPLDSVVSIRFANTGGSNPVAGPADKAFRVRLDDGSSIVGTKLTLEDEKLSLVVDGGEPRLLNLANVAGIEQVNGPVSWLTSRRPSEDVQVPFVGEPGEPSAWPMRLDTDVAGQPLVVAGRQFKRGIGVHAYSRLVYPLDGTYKAFRTRYGINDSLVRADVTVRVRVGDTIVHEMKNVKPGALSPVVVVDLPADAKQLVLEVDYGEGIDVEDRLNWLEPALLRERPKPEPPPATTPATKPAATNPAPKLSETKPAATKPESAPPASGKPEATKPANPIQAPPQAPAPAKLAQ